MSSCNLTLRGMRRRGTTRKSESIFYLQNGGPRDMKIRVRLGRGIRKLNGITAGVDGRRDATLRAKIRTYSAAGTQESRVAGRSVADEMSVKFYIFTPKITARWTLPETSVGASGKLTIVSFR